MINKLNFLQNTTTFCLLLFCTVFNAKQTSAQEQLNSYIREGLVSNQSIKEQEFLLHRSVYALQEAKSMFFPSVTFSTTYTKADGGRTIDFPTGDLFNAAYATLNQLTGSNSFPQLQNQRILLNPDNFYDAKFRTSLPILNAELVYNKRIKSQQVDIHKAEVLMYKRELVKEIKTAYYNYIKATNAISIYQSFLKLLEEGERVNQSLFKNNKINRTAVIRSQNEVSKINASLTAAKKTEESARYYFNFLLNRPLTEAILIDDVPSVPAQDNPPISDVSGREELSKLEIAKGINRNLTSLAKSYLIPKMGTSLDLGSQGFDWKFNDRNRYYLLGLSLEWNLFSSGRNSHKINQSIANQQAISAQTDHVTQQLLTELNVRRANLQSAIAQYKAAESQLKTSRTYYNDMTKLYKEGMAIYIELLDAQNQWVDAQLQSNIALFDTWISFAAIERANASFNLQ
ncbi:TolC family protein [Pedobacter sp. GR22-6]|uniref:TolC family protein n=1 Tax=Pedobacter sp. GR22-6 TaxID=3127957 RepID=UPI00307F94FE